MALDILFFFASIWGIGIGLGLLAKEADDFIERNVMRLAAGLGGMITLGFLLNLAEIPLDWRIFLVAALIPITAKAYMKLKQGKPFSSLKFNPYSLAALALLAVSLQMYASGAFSYPYLEDDDSWSHATGTKYVAKEKTVFADPEYFHFIDPYPPAYDMLMGIIHQTNDSVYFTLKFFNALLAALSVIFFYFFAAAFLRSRRKAFFAAFALFAVPAFLSHFIWAIALTMPLFFASFYSVEKIRDDKRWWIIAAIAIAATLTTSPTHSTYFGLFFLIYFAARAVIERKILQYEFLAGFSGLLLSFFMWWLPMIMRHGITGTLEGVGLRIAQGASVLNVGGTADRVYSFSDFFIAQKANMINNPIGIGIALSLIAIFGVIMLLVRYKDMLSKENYWAGVTLLWLFFSLYAVNAASLQIKLSPFRAWMILAIPVSLIAGEAVNRLYSSFKAIARNFAKSAITLNVIAFLFLGIIAYSVIYTSFVQKYSVNTATWPPGAFWTSGEEIASYVWVMENLPKGSSIFTFYNDGPIIGMDMYMCGWCPEVTEYKIAGFNQTAEENYEWLKANGYEYLIIDGQSARHFGDESTNGKLKLLAESGNFDIVLQNKGAVLFRIK